MDQYIGTPLEVRSDKDAGTFEVSRRVFTEQNILDLENEKDIPALLALFRS